MNDSEFVKLDSVKSSTVNELQKDDIRQAILKSISVTPYYDGLEIKACQAISNINNFSDRKSREELLDPKTGKVFVAQS